jgi:hypothetical protein
MTREQLDDRGLHNSEPFAGFNHYSLTEEVDDARFYPGASERTAIRTLDATIDRVSLVIRCHRSFEGALGYLIGLDDFGADWAANSRWETEEGIFTLITRPTRVCWPGPLIIYCVSEVLADNCLCEECWVGAMAPDGTFIEGFDNFIGF